MGELYQKMARDLELRNFADSTRSRYLKSSCDFVRHYMRSPAELGVPEIHAYLAGILRNGASPEVLRHHVAALRFLYGVTLGRPQIAQQIPWPKVALKQPDILSGTEVATLLAAVTHLKYRAALTTIYAAGLRRDEVCKLQVADIDSKRGLIHVRQGKGRKDRHVMLSEKLLGLLREYCRVVRPPKPYLFPGRRAGQHLSPQSLHVALKRAVHEAGIRKRVTLHLLRHAFATHLLDGGSDIRTVQHLLGHASLRTTAHYAQVSRHQITAFKSPLDVLGTPEGSRLG